MPLPFPEKSLPAPRLVRKTLPTVLFTLAGLVITGWTAPIIEDRYDIGGIGSGFVLNTGVNSGIDPPATRLSGIAAPGLRYITTTTKATTAFSVAANKLRVTPAANPGRFILSADGSTAFNFATILGSGAAMPQSPVVYDLTISMANNSAGVQRFSFAVGTVEGDAGTWSFGLQLYRQFDNANFYTIGKRIDVSSSGLAADLNTFITNTLPGSYGTELSFLIRITDAGNESSAFNSRVQVSSDNGVSWFYDTLSDPDLPNGWRFNGAGRHIMWDVAPNAGDVTYDNFSIQTISVSAGLQAPADRAGDIGPNVILSATVTNRNAGDVDVVFYGREAPRPYPGRDFAVAVLPDSQNYAREAAGNGDAVKEMWFAQTDWIVTNRVQHNIAYVAHLGDIVQSGDLKNGSPNSTEWRNATNAMYRLENPARTLLPDGIPFGLAVGNHDQEPIGEPDGTTTHYNEYFGSARFMGRSYYGGHWGANNDNHFDLFSASGLDFIVLYLEFGRYGNAILNWANAVLATNQHRRAIAVTHFAGSDTTPSNLSAQGSAIYSAFRAHTNFFLMLGGHVFNNRGEGSRSNTYEGRTVRTFVSNYQGRLNGGNGYLRLMYFSPSNNLVEIKTYSPWLNQYETDADSQMSFSYRMQLPTGAGSPGTPYLALSTNSGVASGALATCIWSGLQPKKTYEWYVKVSDSAGNVFTSASRRFATSAKFAPNSVPLAINQSVAIPGDATARLTLQGSDPDGDPITYEVTRQPLNGVITEFNPEDGTVAYMPARGYQGPDFITFIVHDGLTNSVAANLNMTVFAPPDGNGNGLSDAWEALYGVSDPAGDADEDGASNLAEYRANTNPTNAASHLRIVGAEREPSGEFDLVWSSVGGTRYRVQYSDPAMGGGPAGPFEDILRFVYDEMDAAPCGESSTQAFTDTLAPSSGARFYRVRIVP